jgi:hypothetical protein
VYERKKRPGYEEQKEAKRHSKRRSQKDLAAGDLDRDKKQSRFKNYNSKKHKSSANLHRKDRSGRGREKNGRRENGGRGEKQPKAAKFRSQKSLEAEKKRQK